MRYTQRILCAALLGAALVAGGNPAWATQPTTGYRLAKAEKKKAAEAKAEASEAQRSEAAEAPSTSAPHDCPPGEAAFGVGFQANRGNSPWGLSMDLRLPFRLPYEFRPMAGIGFFFNFNQTWFTLPVTLGVMRSFGINGILENKLAAVAGLEAGLLFTNEPARKNDFLAMALLGFEYGHGHAKPFLHVPVGLRAGQLIAYPRVGVVLSM